jgi:hypothetical protein
VLTIRVAMVRHVRAQVVHEGATVVAGMVCESTQGGAHGRAHATLSVPGVPSVTAGTAHAIITAPRGRAAKARVVDTCLTRTRAASLLLSSVGRHMSSIIPRAAGPRPAGGRGRCCVAELSFGLATTATPRRGAGRV